MSVYVINDVLETSPTKGIDRLVLLVMASDADHDGRNSYRGPTSLAKRAGCSRDWVRKVQRRLRAEGHIVPEGLSPLNTRNYRIVMSPDRVASDPGADRPPVGSDTGIGADRTPNTSLDPNSVKGSRGHTRILPTHAVPPAGLALGPTSDVAA